MMTKQTEKKPLGRCALEEKSKRRVKAAQRRLSEELAGFHHQARVENASREKNCSRVEKKDTSLEANVQYVRRFKSVSWGTQKLRPLLENKNSFLLLLTDSEADTWYSISKQNPQHLPRREPWQSR